MEFVQEDDGVTYTPEQAEAFALGYGVGYAGCAFGANYPQKRCYPPADVFEHYRCGFKWGKYDANARPKADAAYIKFQRHSIYWNGTV